MAVDRTVHPSRRPRWTWDWKDRLFMGEPGAIPPSWYRLETHRDGRVVVDVGPYYTGAR